MEYPTLIFCQQGQKPHNGPTEVDPLLVHAKTEHAAVAELEMYILTLMSVGVEKGFYSNSLLTNYQTKRPSNCCG